MCGLAMRPQPNFHSRGILVPPEEVEGYLANSWHVVDDLNPHHVRMLPPVVSRPPKTAEAHADGS
jgi:hypothetical protein